MGLSKEQASEMGKKSSRIAIPNKTTQEIRESFQSLISEKLPELSIWIDKVAKENPEKALDIIIKFSDFIIPKLQRRELKIDDEPKMTRQERELRIAELKNRLWDTK